MYKLLFLVFFPFIAFSNDGDTTPVTQVNESVTETGAECLGCRQQTPDLALSQFENNIATVQEVRPVSVTCTKTNGESITLTEGPFDCPKIAPHIVCTQCKIEITSHEIYPTSVLLYHTCVSGSYLHGQYTYTDPITIGTGINYRNQHRSIPKLGLSCKRD